jgi:hypothetical protein
MLKSVVSGRSSSGVPTSRRTVIDAGHVSALLRGVLVLQVDPLVSPRGRAFWLIDDGVTSEGTETRIRAYRLMWRWPLRAQR